MALIGLLLLLLCATFTSAVKRASPSQAVAFTALRQNKTTVQNGAPFVFDKTTLNIGQGYDVSQGKFTCPLEGVYFFTVTVLSYNNHWFTGNIVLEDRPVAGVYSVGASESADDQSSVAVVIHCSLGQQVWVKATKTSDVNGNNIGFTQFTGFLLTEDEDGGVYAFSAHREYDTVIGAGGALAFDGVETNIGHSYYGPRGQFTCPVNGVYFFTVNILSHVTHQFTSALVMDDRPIAGVNAVGSSADDQSSGSVVIHCTRGQTVWLKILSQSYVNGESVGYTQFTGFLLAPDESPSISETIAASTVAFSAYRKHDRMLAASDAILFDAVQTNIGQSYDANTGKFTCPVAGLYFFTVNILSQMNRLLIATINLDTAPVAGLSTIGASTFTSDQSSVAAVVHCSVGQTVWVQSTRDQILNGEVIPLTQFTGFLIAQDPPAAIVG